MRDPQVTHNTRIDINALSFDTSPQPVQAYAKEGAVALDLNDGRPLIAMAPGSARRVIAILRAAIADIEEGV